MYAYLKGKFIVKTPTAVVIDVHGVGYEVQVSLHTYGRIQALEEGLLYVHLLVREDAHLFYGFFDKAEKDMFLHLLSVSGVGASTARMMLSSLQPAEIAQAILAANESLLESIKGIGKKTAQRIVLELKDKLAKPTAEGNISALNYNSLDQDALHAMTALGIARAAAESAIKKAKAGGAAFTEVQALIKAALKCL